MASALPTNFTANIIYAVNIILLLTCLLDRWSKREDQRTSLMLLRTILLIPLLAAQYGWSNYLTDDQWVAPLFFSENILSLLFVILSLRLQAVLKPGSTSSKGYPIAAAAAVTVTTVGVGWCLRAPAFGWAAGILSMPAYGQLYFSTLFTLLAALLMAWRLEAFWRALTTRYRRQYGYLVLGFLLIFGCLVWSASYRLTYLALPGDHLLLLSFLFLAAWVFIVYAVARHRLLNRRVFISRKVVYSAIVPTVFALYLIGLGLMSLLIRTLGWSLPFVLQWLLIILGLMLIAAIALRHKVRDRVKYFISTHFYLNKYEYRDVWLAFSKLLQGAVAEKDVARALGQILQECLYTRTILIWLGDRTHGFRLVDMEDGPGDTAAADFAPDDPLVAYLQSGRFLYLADHREDPSAKALAEQKREFFQTHDVVLAAALLVGEQCVGLIGLGPEYTGGRYGRDDFDLLATLGSQAASALLAARNAEKLAHIREQSAWGILSAFVMHDIKNAATMLGLVQQNAPHHIHDPEFQKDMLASIDDALNRMTKVQTRLTLLKGEMAPVTDVLDLAPFLRDSMDSLGKRIPGLRLTVACARTIRIRTDREFLFQILENLLLNAREAGGDVGVDIAVIPVSDKQIRIRLCDSGPGIPPEMLPDRLFEPFATSKPKGSGIGLWQVKQLAEALGGTISAENSAGGGACFTFDLPIGKL